MEISFRREAPAVYVAGISRPNEDGIARYLASRGLQWDVEDVEPSMLVELGGRICYESFHNPKGSTREEYLRDSILAHKHGSVLEHVSINFIVEGLPRSILMELTRHRAGTAYSWRSTRFVDSRMEFMVPHYIQNTVAETSFIAATRAAVKAYEETASFVNPRTSDKTLMRKRKRETARHILGGNLTADGLFTCNIRALRHIIQLRTDPHADHEFRRFAYNLFEAASEAAKEFFTDVEVDSYTANPPVVRFLHSERA